MFGLGIAEFIGGIFILLSCLFLIVFVMLQESKTQNGAGALTGGGDSYIGKGRGKTRDAILAKLTKIAAIIFFVLALVLNVIAVLS